MSPRRIVLATASPRRRELLASSGVAFEAIASSAEESHDPSAGLAALVLGNARVKALDVAQQHPEAIVIGADTLVWMDGKPLGKPSSADEARRMLAALSGRSHEVATGVHIVRLKPRLQVEFHEITRVRFRHLDDTAIGSYMENVHVLDKAGAYALQEHGEMIVESIEGSRSNVVGLPITRTLAALERFSG